MKKDYKKAPLYFTSVVNNEEMDNSITVLREAGLSEEKAKETLKEVCSTLLGINTDEVPDDGSDLYIHTCIVEQDVIESENVLRKAGIPEDKIQDVLSQMCDDTFDLLVYDEPYEVIR